MKNTIFTLLFLLGSLLLASCGGTPSDEAEEQNDSLASTQMLDENGETSSDSENLGNSDSEESVATTQDCGFPIASRSDFLNYVCPEGKPKTYQTDSGDYLFFRTDGTMAGGGNDGEGSMWEAKWTFQQNGAGGQIVFVVTMEPGVAGTPLKGTHKVEMFPDDGVLILNCVDYYVTEW